MKKKKKFAKFHYETFRFFVYTSDNMSGGVSSIPIFVWVLMWLCVYVNEHSLQLIETRIPTNF